AEDRGGGLVLVGAVRERGQVDRQGCHEGSGTRHAVEARLVHVVGGAGLTHVLAVVAEAALALRADRRLPEGQEDTRPERDADGGLAGGEIDHAERVLRERVDDAGGREPADRHRRSEEARGSRGAATLGSGAGGGGP